MALPDWFWAEDVVVVPKPPAFKPIPPIPLMEDHVWIRTRPGDSFRLTVWADPATNEALVFQKKHVVKDKSGLGQDKEYTYLYLLSAAFDFDHQGQVANVRYGFFKMSVKDYVNLKAVHEKWPLSQYDVTVARGNGAFSRMSFTPCMTRLLDGHGGHGIKARLDQLAVRIQAGEQF